MTKRIVPFVPFTAADPTDLTFSQLKKRNSAGGNLKNAKGFSGGARAGLPAQALWLSLRGPVLSSEMGSSEFKKSLHEIK